MAGSLEYEKLTAFFLDLPAGARTRLSAALHSESGAEIPYRTIILEPLMAAQRALGELPQTLRAEELLLAPLDPFVLPIDVKTKTTGLIGHTFRERLPKWLATDGAPDIVRELDEQLARTADKAAQDTAIDQAQDKLSRHLEEALAAANGDKARNRLVGRIGGNNAGADLEDTAVILKRRFVLAKFAAETSGPISGATGPNMDETLKTLKTRLDPIAAKHPELLPFALVLVRKKLPTPQTFARLAAVACETTDAARILETPFVCILDLALAEAEREQIRAKAVSSSADRGQILQAVRGFGAATRALGTEVDLLSDGHHAKRLAGLKREIADSVRADLQDLSPRVRRLVRPRAQERNFEQHEIDRLVADLDLLLIARSYAEEIAMNALSSRIFSEVRELLDTGTPPLIERLRAADESAKPALKSRLSSIVTVSAKIFGSEYASLMSKAVEVASQPAQQRSA